MIVVTRSGYLFSKENIINKLVTSNSMVEAYKLTNIWFNKLAFLIANYVDIAVMRMV